jgi:hypothetical protein
LGHNEARQALLLAVAGVTAGRTQVENVIAFGRVHRPAYILQVGKTVDIGRGFCGSDCDLRKQ